MALNTEENILLKTSLIRQWRSQQRHVPTIVTCSKEMLGFAATARASEGPLKHERCQNAERLALAREHTEQLTLLEREVGKRLETFSSPLALHCGVLGLSVIY